MGQVPSNTISPVVTGMSPAIQLKKVDLPAPFRTNQANDIAGIDGEIGARDGGNCQLFETFFASSSVARLHLLGAIRSQRSNKPPGSKRAMDNDAAVENISQTRASAPEPGIGRGLQRNEDQGADRRPKGRAGAAKRRQ
jgi:hypothetical protein